MDTRDMNELLEAIGWSKTHFAKRIDVTFQTVWRWEKNTPKLAILYLRSVAQNMGV